MPKGMPPAWKNGRKPAPLETKGCGTLKSKTNPKAKPPASLRWGFDGNINYDDVFGSLHETKCSGEFNSNLRGFVAIQNTPGV
jgi:hypothetical protein